MATEKGKIGKSKIGFRTKLLVLKMSVMNAIHEPTSSGTELDDKVDKNCNFSMVKENASLLKIVIDDARSTRNVFKKCSEEKLHENEYSDLLVMEQMSHESRLIRDQEHMAVFLPEFTSDSSSLYEQVENTKNLSSESGLISRVIQCIYEYEKNVVVDILLASECWVTVTSAQEALVMVKNAKGKNLDQRSAFHGVRYRNIGNNELEALFIEAPLEETIHLIRKQFYALGKVHMEEEKETDHQLSSPLLFWSPADNTQPSWLNSSIVRYIRLNRKGMLSIESVKRKLAIDTFCRSGENLLEYHEHQQEKFFHQQQEQKMSSRLMQSSVQSEMDITTRKLQKLKTECDVLVLESGERENMLRNELKVMREICDVLREENKLLQLTKSTTLEEAVDSTIGFQTDSYLEISKRKIEKDQRAEDERRPRLQRNKHGAKSCSNIQVANTENDNHSKLLVCQLHSVLLEKDTALKKSDLQVSELKNKVKELQTLLSNKKQADEGNKSMKMAFQQLLGYQLAYYYQKQRDSTKNNISRPTTLKIQGCQNKGADTIIYGPNGTTIGRQTALHGSCTQGDIFKIHDFHNMKGKVLGQLREYFSGKSSRVNFSMEEELCLWKQMRDLQHKVMSYTLLQNGDEESAMAQLSQDLFQERTKNQLLEIRTVTREPIQPDFDEIIDEKTSVETQTEFGDYGTLLKKSNELGRIVNRLMQQVIPQLQQSLESEKFHHNSLKNQVTLSFQNETHLNSWNECWSKLEKQSGILREKRDQMHASLRMKMNAIDCLHRDLKGKEELMNRLDYQLSVFDTSKNNNQ